MALIFLLIGLITGFFAGFFGIGGGVIIVPTLLICFKALHFPQQSLIHMAIGTSLSCILMTSLSSSYSHLKKIILDKFVYFNILIGIFFGTISGGYLTNYIPSLFLEVFFTLYLAIILTQLFLAFDTSTKVRPISKWTYWVAGYVIGLKSSLLGIGGGTITIPFLNWTGKKMHEAAALSSTLSIPIAFFGSLAYLFSGLKQTGLPSYSLGYIYLPAFFGIGLASFFSAKLGAMASHKVSHANLKKIFRYFLLIILIKSLHGLTQI